MKNSIVHLAGTFTINGGSTTCEDQQRAYVISDDAFETDENLFNLLKWLEHESYMFDKVTKNHIQQLQELGLVEVSMNHLPVEVSGCKSMGLVRLTSDGFDVMNHLNPNKRLTQKQILENRAEGVTRLICETYDLKLGKNQKIDMAALILNAMTNPYHGAK